MEFFVIAFLLTVAGAHQGGIEGPQNTLGIVGSDVTLSCSTSAGNCSDIDWDKSPVQTNPETYLRTIFTKGRILQPYRDRYNINTSSGCDLVIYDVKLTDAGRFTCRTYISGKTFEKNADLTVLETEPKCAINALLTDTMEGDGVHLTCEVTYNGTGKSFMMWKDVENAPAPVENGKTIRRSYSVVASAPEVPSFTCVTSFEAKVIVNGSALNIPTTVCETPAVKVLYPAMDVNLSPSLTCYSPGTIITCAAKGHPSPSFRWQERVKESNGTWMDIRNQTSNQFSVNDVTSRRYRCVAGNVVRGKSYSATSYEFSIINTDQLTSTWTHSSTCNDGVGIGIGFAIGLLVSMLLSSIAFASLVRFGYLEFHLRPGDQSHGAVEQPMKQNRSHSSHQHSPIPNREAASGGQQESAYESLGYDKDTNTYESLEQRQRAKPKKNSRP